MKLGTGNLPSGVAPCCRVSGPRKTGASSRDARQPAAPALTQDGPAPRFVTDAGGRVVTYSRIRARTCFGASPEALRGRFSSDLPEKAKTFSGLFGALIHTLVMAFGAFAARRLISSPIKTYRTASPSGSKPSGASR